ncbi:MAG: N-acetylmuramoyl-L-alanine amidase [Bacillota bacterium]
MKVFIDPGHGGKDRANRGPAGYVEADGVLDMAKRLRLILETVPGMNVKMSREADETVALYDRPKMANAWGADIFISIHTNAGPPAAHGIETFHSLQGEWGSKSSSDARRLAGLVQQELVKATGLSDRGIKTRLVTTGGSPIQGMDFYAVIRRTKCPAIITEVGFHSNPREEALLKTDSFRQKAAEAIASGVKKYYGIKEDAEKLQGTFTDVPQNHWAAGAIRFVSDGERAIMSGFSDGAFKPDEPVTRAQLAVVAERIYNLLRK